MSNKFYMAVDDVKTYTAKFDVEKQKIIFTYINAENVQSEPKADIRILTDRFSKDIPTAILRVICCNDYNYMRDEENRKVISDFLRVDEQNNVYYFDEFFTLGTGKTPKTEHWDEFYAGNYEFFCNKHEIQVFETVQTECVSKEELQTFLTSNPNI